MRKRWVVLLTVLAFAVAAYWTMGQIGGSMSRTGLHIACELLDTAEASKILTKEQRNEVIERVQKRMRKYSGDSELKPAEWLGAQLKASCPILLEKSEQQN